MIRQTQPIEEAYSSVNNIDKQYENLQNQKSNQHMSVFEVIKKVVNKEYDISKFYEIYDTIL